MIRNTDTAMTTKPWATLTFLLAFLFWIGLGASPLAALFPLAFGGTGFDGVEDSVAGASGAVYVTGSFNGTLELPDRTLRSAGSSDVFVAKVDELGNRVWTVRGGGAGGDAGRAITVDAAENVYVTGWFRGDVTFGEDLFSIALDGDSGDDFELFVLKLSGDTGEPLWVAKATGPGNDAGLAIDFLPEGSGSFDTVVIGGYGHAAVDFYDEGDSEKNFTAGLNNATESPLMAAIDLEGTWRWYVKADPTGDGTARIEHLAFQGTLIYALGSTTVDLEFFVLNTPQTIPADRQFLAVTTQGAAWALAGAIGPLDVWRDMAVDASSHLLLAGTQQNPLAPRIARASLPHLQALWDVTLASGEGEAVTFDAGGNVYLAGTEADGDLFVAKFDSDGNQLEAATAAGGTLLPETITSNRLDEIYVGGAFSGRATFGNGTNGELIAVESFDGFLANLSTDLEWFEISDIEAVVGEPIPPPPGAETTKAQFIPDFFQDGVQIQALDRFFKWSPPEAHDDDQARLYPLKVPESGATIEIRWRIAGEPLETGARIPQRLTVVWPRFQCGEFENGSSITGSCFQLHIATAPVEILPKDGALSFLELHPSDTSDAEVKNGSSFNATKSGWSTLVYTRGPVGSSSPLEFEVVQTVQFRDPSPGGSPVPHFRSGSLVQIGTEIPPDSMHQEPDRNGYVLNEKAYFDGVGPTRAYDREARTGQIIPVNVVRPGFADAERRMVVAWYRKNVRKIDSGAFEKEVYWPERAVEYSSEWRTSDRIIITSQQGSEGSGQGPLDPTNFPSLHLYNQPDPNLPGFNPNDEHALIAASNTGSGVPAIFALRTDFGGNIAPRASSEPYVLAKYRDPDTGKWRFKVYEVTYGSGTSFEGTAGTRVQAPYPLSLQQPCAQSRITGEPADPGSRTRQPPVPFYRDTNDELWARAAGRGWVEYYYPLQPGWHYDLDDDDRSDVEPLTCVPWNARLPESAGGTFPNDRPVQTVYDIAWPDETPLLTVGETLLEPKRRLPDVFNQASVKVAYDQLKNDCEGDSPPAACGDSPLDPRNSLTQLIDPLGPRTACATDLVAAVPGDPDSPRVCPTDSRDLPEADLATERDAKGKIVITGNAAGDLRLPFALHSRLRYDPLNNEYAFSGLFDGKGAGEPLLLLNVMSRAERDQLLALSENDDYQNAIEKLFRKSRNPQGIREICTLQQGHDCAEAREVSEDDVLIGYQDCLPDLGETGCLDEDGDGLVEDGDGILEPFAAEGVQAALTAGAARDTGYVTLVFNDSENLALPVSLEVIEVGCLVLEPPPEPRIETTYVGQVNVIEAANLFDEQLTLRHSGDFGGRGEELDFEWWVQADQDGSPPPIPDDESNNGWALLDQGLGKVQVTLGGANLRTLSDNWFLARYKGLPVCGNESSYSLFAGQPGSPPREPRAQLGEGWVKRVTASLNPFETRVKEFHRAPTNTLASMIAQLGERYEGPIALNDDPDNVNNLGLIEAYQTVMRRALQLSIDGTPRVDYEPANAAILNVASRLSDFYTLLGNEAYADALDPTIGISTDEVQFGLGTLAPTLFNFQNQAASLLEEELVLLRGRDDSQATTGAAPVYNRYFWNFTRGDGEIAYALSYNISDQDTTRLDGEGPDGEIDEFDARILYPQGHGDAWGHYLTAMKVYLDLLHHPYYSWNPRVEAVTVAGVPLQVDFLDERKFAKAAAARAKAGAEIVDLTYRSAYVEDPAGQWQGYRDLADASAAAGEERAWGLAGWSRRAGVGAYLDWVVGNAVLPAVDPNAEHRGIERIDRTTVDELDEIASAFAEIQTQVDEADRGLNPLGLATGVVPFDVDPAEIDRGKTQFEQVFERATQALDNGVTVWNFANQLNRMLRFNQDEVDDLTRNKLARERDFKSRLIEIFGRPYPEDVGPGGTYPRGYDGPDLYNYDYVNVPALSGTPFDVDPLSGEPEDPRQRGRIHSFTIEYKPIPGLNSFFDCGETSDATQCQRPAFSDTEDPRCGEDPLGDGCSLGAAPDARLEVEKTVWELPNQAGFAAVKPPRWTRPRPAAGEIQSALNRVLNAQISLRKAIEEYDKLRLDIECAKGTLEATFNVRSEQIRVKNEERRELKELTKKIGEMRSTVIALRRVADGQAKLGEAAAGCVPDNVIAGVAAGGDVLSAVKCAVKISFKVQGLITEAIADGVEIAANVTESGKEDVGLQAAIELDLQDARLEQFVMVGDLTELLRREPVLRTEIFARAQVVEQAGQGYRNALAKGTRLLDELVTFRKNTASATQNFRHQDMAFRIFRNDALQKYRAAFDLAARYAYLAASAYDYNTNLLGTDGRSGRNFLTDIVRQRSLGQILEGEPVPGSPGLADALARMKLNFQVLKSQMGFNNPQVEANRFSLRREHFRVTDDVKWRQDLESHRVENLWDVPEFRRFARPFTNETSELQPGLVVPFDTTVTFGMNFFGEELGASDSAYDPTQFATRIRSVGVWLGGYGGLPLSQTPRVYLIPVGADVLRPPTAGDFTTREWAVVDQLIPVPFPIGGNDLESPAWTPQGDTLSGGFDEIRRIGSFRAFDFDPSSDFAAETVTDSRLVGRSVWNTRWLLIIPGGTLLADPSTGLDTFIEGVSDIYVYFKTYAYSGF